MTNWEVEISRRLDQIAVDAEDWEAVVDMLAEVGESSEAFYNYLGLLEARVKQMRRRMNRVTFHAAGTRHYKVWNYDWKMYDYLSRHYPGQFVEQPLYLAIPFEVLTPKDRDAFQEKVEPL